MHVFVFYFSLLSSLSSLTFLFLFPVASPFLSGSWFELLPSKVRQSRTSKPKCLRSVATNMEVDLHSGVIWFCGLSICDFDLWSAWAWVSRLWVCDFRLWSAWVSRLWVWVVVGCGAVDRQNGFDFVEVCRGGFVCVCVCMFCSPAWWVCLSIFLLANLGFVIVMVVDLWFGRGR